MLKGGCSDIVVENNQFYNLCVTYGALTLGGASSGGQAHEGVNLLARNNVFRDISGPYVVLFAASQNCKFVNNLVCHAEVGSLIAVSLANRADPKTDNLDPWIVNNIFYRNSVKEGVLNVGAGASTGLRVDHNLIAESGAQFVFDQQKVDLADLPKRGLELHGVRSTPRFVDLDARDFRPRRRIARDRLRGSTRRAGAGRHRSALGGRKAPLTISGRMKRLANRPR